MKNSSIPASSPLIDDTAFNPLRYPACFFEPARVSDVRSWQQHIPFAFAITQMLRPQCFVELGTHKGDSFLAFCQAVAALGLSSKCYAVDTWAGDEHSGHYGNDIYAELSAYHDQHYGGFSRLIRSTFDEAVSYFADGSIDLLHIDGLHTYEAVRHDFETWRAKLSTKAVVLFHDVNVREREFGVWRYWDEIRQKYPSFTFAHGHGLGVLAVGNATPPALAELIAVDESRSTFLQQFFFHLGSRIEASARLGGLVANEASAQTSSLQVFRATMAALDTALTVVGLDHPRFDVVSDEHSTGQYAAWVHRGLGELSERVNARDLRIGSLAAEIGLRDHRVESLGDELQRERDARDQLISQISQLYTDVAAKGNDAGIFVSPNGHRANADSPTDQLETLRNQFSQLTEAYGKQRADAEQLGNEAKTVSSRLSMLEAHAMRLEEAVRAMRSSLSWRISAPLRWAGALFNLRIRGGTELSLYRAFYAFPGLSPVRKRKLILWLHQHAAFLTRNTISYQLYERSKDFERQAQNAGSGGSMTRARKLPRMDEQKAAGLISTWSRPPLISVVMPVYNIDQRWLHAAVDSVRRQFYPHWELCIADDASTMPQTREALAALEGEGDPRIRIVHLERNCGIALASNAAFEMARGEFVGLLDHDDVLTRDALLEMAKAIVEHDPDLVYSDEDKTDETGVCRDPFFKPDFSPEFFLSNNYLCHFTVLRTEILRRIGGFRTGVDGAQDFDLFLRFTAHSNRVMHIRKVLYHWRMISGSTAATASAKPYTWEAGRLALQHRLELTSTDARAEKGPYPNTYRIRYAIRGNPLVSIVIPFRDKPELLGVCVRSILKLTEYRNFEIIGVDNGSVDAVTHNLIRTLEKEDPRVRFVRYEHAFNYSAINNFGALHGRGEHLLFLNNDTEVLASEWLTAMLEFSQRPDVGVVGAKLLYSDDTVQHAGVILDRNVVAMHPHQYLSNEHPGYAARPHLLQNLSAVTFACAMTRRDVFDRLGGLNETDLAICYNDVDYCLRAREQGYLVVFTPYAVLRHFESKSRGNDDTPEKQARFRHEFSYMQTRHSRALAEGDPYYNPNLSLGIQGGFHADPSYAEELPH